jgi:TP901 family phage tail tape measure protein
MAQGKINKNQIAGKDVFQNIEEGAKTANASVKSLEITMKAVVETAKQVKASASSSDPTNNKSIRERNELLAKSDFLSKAKLRTEKQIQTARIAELRLQKQREQAFDKFDKKQKKAVQTSIKARKETIKQNDAYKKLNAQVSASRDRFKRLATQHGANSKQAQRAAKSYRILSKRLRGIDKAASKASGGLSRMGSLLKTGAGFLGLTTILFGVARAFGDAFDRIREFDKEMQNLAGISGISRENLKLTEDAIKEVAGSSIRTANEVAKLATTLTALGKTQQEVRALLKPTNDLSIALNATSDEAGELLVSTLNAFGKGAEEGQHFADVIAKMRTSTSLDFERIKDSLGFVAATANVMNLSIGETGALIGVLQDNGIKAARSGRLLNSSFIKLAKEGKTLEGSLDRLNAAQERGASSSEILRIAEKDFGTQSASLGVILSKNRDRIAELSNEFDNLSEGALKDLTDEQLKSMDAQLKILDSTWERLILSFENGTGILSKLFRGVISELVGFLNIIERVGTGFSLLTNEATKFTDRLKIVLNGFSGLINNSLLLPLRKVAEAFDAIAGTDIASKLKIPELRLISTDVNALTKEFSKLSQEQIRSVDGAKKIIKAYINAGLDIKEATIAYKNLRIETKEYDNKLKDLDETIGGTGKSTRELTGLIEAQAKAVSDLNNEIGKAKTEEQIFSLGLDLEKEKEELERLKRIYTSTLEEIAKIEIDLIKDATDRRIEQEEAKSKKLIQIIITNSRITSEKRIELLKQEEKRMIQFREDAEKSRFEKAIDDAAKLRIAEFDVTRSGFKTEEEFQKERAKQLQAIERNRLQARLDLLKFFGNEEDKLEIAQLKAKLASLYEFEKKKNILTEKEAEDNAKAIQFTEDLAVKSFDAKLERLEKEEEAGRDALSEYKQAAREGNITAKESLAEQEQLAEEAARKQQKIEQDKQNFLMVTAVLQAFNAELAKTDDVAKALTTAITSTTVLSQFASALPAFLDGTENTGEHGQGVDGKGGFHALLHSNERVLTSDENDRIGNFTNEEVAQTMEKKRMGNLVGDTQLIAMANGVDMSGMEAKLLSIEKAIIDKPENKIELGAITQATMEILETRKVGNRTTFNRFKVKN